MNATVTTEENMTLTLGFGTTNPATGSNHSRYEETLYDGSTTENISTDDDINEHGDLNQGALLRTRFTPTAGEDGFDTGQVNIPGRESAVVRLQTYTGSIVTPVGAPIPSHGETIDKTQFYVYDIYGRGYSIDVKDSGTISSFDGTTLVVDQASLFDDASDTNKQLIAVEKAGTSDIEFMLYDNKNNTSLTISNRVLYTGLGHTFTNLDTVYVLDTPLQIVLQENV